MVFIEHYKNLYFKFKIFNYLIKGIFMIEVKKQIIRTVKALYTKNLVDTKEGISL